MKLVREMMTSDNCDESKIEEFLKENEAFRIIPDSEVATSTGKAHNIRDPIVKLDSISTNEMYSIVGRKVDEFGDTYLLQIASSLEFIRIEQNCISLLGMAADCILFSCTDSLSTIKETIIDKIIGIFLGKVSDLDVDIKPFRSVNSLKSQPIDVFDGSLFNLFLKPADSIDLFDGYMEILKDLNLSPFPDYIMDDLSEANRAHDYLNLRSAQVNTSYSTWNSPYGVPMEPIFNFKPDRKMFMWEFSQFQRFGRLSTWSASL